MEQTGRKEKVINSVLLGGYLLLVWTAFAILTNEGTIPILCLLVILAGVLAFTLPRLLSRIEAIRLPQPAKFTGRQKAKVFITAFLATAAVLLVWIMRCPPGGFAIDGADQYNQALTGNYHDWHPVLHTLIFYTLPLRLTGWGYSIYLFQYLLFCTVMAFTLTIIAELGGYRFACLAWCYIMINPFVGYTVVFPLKDTGFALACMTAAILSVQIWCTKGKAAQSPIRCIILGLSLAAAALFRHNGILFSGFLLAAMIFTMKKHWWKTALSCALIPLLLYGVLYKALDVDLAGDRVTEITGLPLSVIGNVVKATPNLLDQETAEFAYAIAPKEDWDRYFQRGSFNSIKWRGIDKSPIENGGIRKILRMTLHCFQRSPEAALKGLIDLTDLVYGLDSPNIILYTPYFEENPPELTQKKNAEMNSAIMLYEKTLNATPFRYLFSIGASMLLVLTVMLARCDLRKREDWSRILPALSLFCYNFGTMLLLTGPDDRFFLVSFLVCPVYMLLMLYERPIEMIREQGAE